MLISGYFILRKCVALWCFYIPCFMHLKIIFSKYLMCDQSLHNMESNICALCPSYSIHVLATFDFCWSAILHPTFVSCMLWQIVFTSEPKFHVSSIYQFFYIYIYYHDHAFSLYFSKNQLMHIKCHYLF
jgi:hypothetical protein